MLRRSVRRLALLLVLTPALAHAQLGRLKGRISKDRPDSAEAARQAAEDSTKAASGEPAEKKSRFGVGGLMSKVTSKVVATTASMAGGMMTGSTADLGTVTPFVTRSANTYPKSVGTMETNLIRNWGDGGDLVTVTFTQKAGAMTSKIDGAVTIDGQPADYATMGVYSAMAKPTAGPRRVEVTTSSGQRGALTIPAPRGALRIVRVNGQANPARLDLTKDVTIELEGVTPGDTTPILVKVVTSVLGLRGFYDTYYAKPGATITVPAAAFRNVNVAPGNVGAGANLKDSYLLVSRERWEDAGEATGAFAGVQVFTSESDGRAFSAEPAPALNRGLTAKATQALSGGPLTYSLYKPNAFASRPLAQAARIATISFATRGTTHLEKSRQVTQANGDQVRETRTLKFPQLPAATWDAALATLHAALTPVFAEELGATFVPIERVVATDAYASLSPYARDDESTAVDFTQTYRGTKLVSALVPLAEGYGWKRVDARLMRETGATALLKVTLDLQISEKNGGSMTPTLGFELVGAPNGHSTSTKFVSGTITGEGRPIKKGDNLADPAVLAEVMRARDMATALRAALKDLAAREGANGDYQALWAGR